MDTFINDSLYDLVGFSEPNLVEYIGDICTFCCIKMMTIAGRKAKSPQQVIDRLRSLQLQATDNELNLFAERLYNRANGVAPVRIIVCAVILERSAACTAT